MHLFEKKCNIPTYVLFQEKHSLLLVQLVNMLWRAITQRLQIYKTHYIYSLTWVFI